MAASASSGLNGRAARLVAVVILLAVLAFSGLAALRPGGWVWLIPGPIYIIALVGGSARPLLPRLPPPDHRSRQPSTDPGQAQ